MKLKDAVPDGCESLPPDHEWAVKLTKPQAIFHLCGDDGWKRLPPDLWEHSNPCSHWCGARMPKPTAALLALQFKFSPSRFSVE